jgi:hypothetical protein
VADERSYKGTVASSEILAKIENGEDVEYDGFIIEGNLDISSLALSEPEGPNGEIIINSKISITNSRINGFVKFERFIMEGGGEKDDVWNRTIIFKKGINFSGTLFNGIDRVGVSAYFYFVQFDGGAGFIKSQFEGDAYFWFQFKNKDAPLDAPYFSPFPLPTSSPNFARSQFNGVANFGGSQFDNANFNGSQFNSHAHFGTVTFANSASFDEVQFKGNVNFKEAQFEGDASFHNSQFDGYYTVFNLAQFKGDADFNSSRFKEDVFFENVSFSGVLILNSTKYEKLYIRWRDISKTKHKQKILEDWDQSCILAYEDTAYLLLIDNFKKLGFFEDADKCYYYYRNKHRQYIPTFYKPIDLILMGSYGYGVKPIRPLLWSVVFLLAFSVLYAITTIPSYVEAFNLSLLLFLSGAKLVETPAYPSKEMAYYLIFAVEKSVGTVLLALFVISLGKTIIR